MYKRQILSPEQTTTVLLETMAGKGTEVGSHFEELREILDRVTLSDLMGVCLDTCHVFDAGYDIVNDLDGVLTEFDRVIGLNRLKAVHINDSIFGLSSHKDRHAKIGEGKIGTEAFRRKMCIRDRISAFTPCCFKKPASAPWPLPFVGATSAFLTSPFSIS